MSHVHLETPETVAGSTKIKAQVQCSSCDLWHVPGVPPHDHNTKKAWYRTHADYWRCKAKNITQINTANYNITTIFQQTLVSRRTKHRNPKIMSSISCLSPRSQWVHLQHAPNLHSEANDEEIWGMRIGMCLPNGCLYKNNHLLLSSARILFLSCDFWKGSAGAVFWKYDSLKAKKKTKTIAVFQKIWVHFAPLCAAPFVRRWSQKYHQPTPQIHTPNKNSSWSPMFSSLQQLMGRGLWEEGKFSGRFLYRVYPSKFTKWLQNLALKLPMKTLTTIIWTLVDSCRIEV